MRKLFTIIPAVVLTSIVVAQSPQKMNYQAVIRDANNILIKNHAVGMRLSILQTTSSGTAVYVETQTATTNINGLVTVEIGSGTTVTGTLASIDWSAGPYFIKAETDPSGGINYNTVTDIKQLLSVPYALYSKTKGGHYIGELYGGGIVVSVVKIAGVEHGLIASLTNLGPDPGSPWCDISFINTLIGPAAQSLTDGQSNTNAIVAQSPTYADAAKLCADYTITDGTGTYSDWYLPSIRELKECYTAKFAVTNILGILDGFLFDNYWSSTENPNNVAGEKTAYFIGFHIGILNPGGHKGHFLRVRAVRKF